MRVLQVPLKMLASGVVDGKTRLVRHNYRLSSTVYSWKLEKLTLAESLTTYSFSEGMASCVALKAMLLKHSLAR